MTTPVSIRRQPAKFNSSIIVNRRLTSAAVDRAVSARLERQAILQRENPPMSWHVLHEGVLRHVVGSPAIMREQLDKLAALAREPGARRSSGRGRRR